METFSILVFIVALFIYLVKHENLIARFKARCRRRALRRAHKELLELLVNIKDLDQEKEQLKKDFEQLKKIYKDTGQSEN